MKTLISVLTIVFAVSVQAQDRKTTLLENFQSADWKVVKQAKAELENYEGEIVADLVELCKKKDFVKLENTGSLIYPGAAKFYGYGQIIEYDIDRISVRAGWLIEELTFGNFGFGGVHLPKEQLESFIKITFSDYYNNSTNRKKLQSMPEEEIRSLIIDLSIQKVSDWWAGEKAGWKRVEALYEALRSYDEKRQVKGLFYIRNGTSKCTGLTKDFYIDKLYREIVRLSSSDVQRVAEHASFVLMDIKFDWLSLKTQ